VDYLPGDVGGALRGQERDQLRYFVRLAVPLGGRACEDQLADGVEHRGGHRCPDGAGGDGVHRDVSPARHLGCEGARQRVERRLARRIGSLPLHATSLAGDRADEDEAAGAPAEHVGQDQLSGDDRGPVVDVEYVAHPRQVAAEDGHPAGHARAVHEDVDWTEIARDVSETGAKPRLVADVCAADERDASGGFDAGA